MSASIQSTGDAAISGDLSFSTRKNTEIFERMRINEDGNVGIGTDAPTTILTVAGNATDDWPRDEMYKWDLIRLEGNGQPRISIKSASNDQYFNPVFVGTRARGTLLAPQAVQSGDTLWEGIGWGYAGSNIYGPAGAISIEADAAPAPFTGGGSVPGHIKFGTTDVGGDWIQTRMIIKNDGNVGIGLNNPDHNLHIKTTAAGELAGIRLESESTSHIHFTGSTRDYSIGKYETTNDKFYIADSTANENRLVIIPNGNIGIGDTTPEEKLTVNGVVKAASFTPPSDIRLKENIQPVGSALDKIMKLKGVTFIWKENKEKGMGVIAQDVEEVFPEIVRTGKESGMKGVNYDSLIAPLIESVKELKAENDALKLRIEALENKLNQ